MRTLLVGAIVLASLSSYAQGDYLAYMYVDTLNYEKRVPIEMSSDVKEIKLSGKLKIEAGTNATLVNDSCYITHEYLDNERTIEIETLNLSDSRFLLFLNEKRGWFSSYRAGFQLQNELNNFICVLPFKDDLPTLKDFELELSNDAQLIP